MDGDLFGGRAGGGEFGDPPLLGTQWGVPVQGSVAWRTGGAELGNYNGFLNPGSVSVIDPSNTVSTIVLGDSTVSPGYVFNPKCVAVSPNGAYAGYVYVGGYYGDIAVIDPSGSIVGNIGGSFGYDPGGLAVGPTGANAGNIYLASAADRRVTVLSPAGAYLETIFVGIWSMRSSRWTARLIRDFLASSR